MFKTARRATGVVVVAVLIVAGAIVAYLLLPPLQTGDVSVPPDDATPEQVVTAYINSLNTHDCGTAEALMTHDATSEAHLWCDEVSKLSALEVRKHFVEDPKYSGLPASEHEVEVPVSFDLHWRLFHDDGSMNEGPTDWGYELVRASDRSPWRILDQGTG